jgi:hypothetical protein
MIRKSVVFLLILSILLPGCAATKFEPYKPPELKFEKTAKYNVQDKLKDIPKPDRPERKLAILNGNKISFTEDANQANVVLFDFNEYRKIAALLELTKTYKHIVLEQEALVNIHIDTINAYKEFLELERLKALAYRDLWVDSENRYREERHDHKVDNFMNKGLSTLLFLTNIATVAFFGFK